MQPFRINIPEADLEDLQRRLAATRWPETSPGMDWERGVPLDYLRDLVSYWRTEFDWRAAEAKLNEFPQFRVEIAGTPIHFLHVRSPEPDATPMIMTHGWPGSFVEFTNVIGPLTDPRAHGGDPSQAFHLVIPSLPGFGFSNPVADRGWSFFRTAGAWAELMGRLGYDRYVIQGADLGTWVGTIQAGLDAEHVAGLHLNFLITPPSPDPADLIGLSETELGRLGLLSLFADEGSGYMKLQATRPQTLAYSLTDSPVGQLAWIVEKFMEWTDAEKSPDDAVDRDQLLTNATLYWLTRSGASSAHFYCDNAPLLPTAPNLPPPPPVLPVPLGVSVFPRDPAQPIRRFAERVFPNIVQWSEHDRGGHFAAMEEPDLLTADLRSFAAAVRATTPAQSQ
ncbi:epoxide hydrolase family protein [Streptomyces sp. NPDC056010]|uniref:epoxide hydrolase family protein n=1 Tax=Streptomyces sp. NPDC056010 TaxID=3345679 RepID=UPI0035DCD1B9